MIDFDRYMMVLIRYYHRYEEYVLMGLFCFGFIILFFLVLHFMRKRKRFVEQRCLDIRDRVVLESDELVSEYRLDRFDLFFESAFFLNLFLIGPYYRKKFERLKQNDLKIKPKEYVLFSTLLPIVLFGLTYFLLHMIVVSVVCYIIGFVLPNIYIDRLCAKRQLKFDEQLPDCLVILANGLRAGLSFIQSLSVAFSEMDNPLKGEFERVLQDISIGRSLDAALTDMSNRTNNENLRIFATAVITQRQVGGNLSEILDLISQTVRSKLAMRRKIKTLMAQNKMSAMIIGALPVFLTVVIYFVSPGYLEPLYTDPLGKIAIGIAVGLIAIGMFVLSKITNIDV